MDPDAPALLSTPQGAAALALAAEQPDPTGLAAAQRLRSRFPPELAAAALTQAELRRRARTKFGARAAELFLTRDGLEQATRPVVAAHHAARFVAAGVRRVLDLGCGIGADALAFCDAGLEVVAVELDPATAATARLNLAGRAEVVTGDAEALAADLAGPGTGVFCDPARRTDAGRLWRVEDFTPSWSFVTGLLASGVPAGVKLGPALPHSLVPAGVEAEWVGDGGDTVEVALWGGPGSRPGGRVATLLGGGRLDAGRLVVPDPVPELPSGAPRRYVYEPAGAVIRAGGVTYVGELVHGALLDPRIAYLTSDELVRTPLAVAFEVLEVLPYQEKVLRRRLRERGVGSCEIKKRGIDVDPARLRVRLGLRGPEHATLILTRTPHGALALVARRVPAEESA